MPLYEMLCDSCSETHDIYCRYDQRAEQVCPTCRTPMVSLISGIKLVGAAPSKPIDMTKQFGRVFETNKEYRTFLAENNYVERDKSSLRPQIDKSKNNRERLAASQGYSSWRERCADLRKKAASEANTPRKE